jgi:hypothetical protein
MISIIQIFVKYSIEVVISHPVFYGLFIILSTVHPRQMIGHNIFHALLITDFNIELLEKKDLTNQLLERYLMAA